MKPTPAPAPCTDPTCPCQEPTMPDDTSDYPSPILVRDQPAPSPGLGDVWGEIIAQAKGGTDFLSLVPMMEERRALGIARYGTPLQRANGRDHEADAAQELLDAAAYLWAAGRDGLAVQALDTLLMLRGEAPGIHGPATALREFLAVLGALPVGTVGVTPAVQAAGKAMDASDRELVNAAFVSVANDAIGQIDRSRGLEAFASSRDARACRVLLRDLRAGAEGSGDGTPEQIDAIMILLGLDA